MALTQQQIKAFTSLKAKLFGTGGELLTGEQDILLTLVTISDQLSALTTALTGIVPENVTVNVTGGTNTIEEPVVPTVPSVVISWDPHRLDEIILLTEDLQGSVSDTVTQFPLTIPAASGGVNGSVTVSIPPPPQSAAKLFGPLVITTDSVGAQMSIAATVDGHNVIGEQGFVLGPSTEIAFHQFTVATQTGMAFTISNPSTAPVTIYFKAELMIMTMAFYNSIYHPIIESAFKYVRKFFGVSAS